MTVWHGWTKEETVLQALQMLLHQLDGKDRMLPVDGSKRSGSKDFDLARNILGLFLESPNRHGQCWWRLRRGWEDRLIAAGVDPKTGDLINPFKFREAVKRVAQENAAKTRTRMLRGLTNGKPAPKHPALPQTAAGYLLNTPPASKPPDMLSKFRKKVTEGPTYEYEEEFDSTTGLRLHRD